MKTFDGPGFINTKGFLSSVFHYGLRNALHIELKAIIFTLLLSFPMLSGEAQVLLPIQSKDRTSLRELKLTPIGQFGLRRKSRTNIPAHLHTGIDIKRPYGNYQNEPIYPLAKGRVISKRDDGPYAQLIIEHTINDNKIWTVYEHIAGITCRVNEAVDPSKPIARFMNREELNRNGWQFDHFHFEILKQKPLALARNNHNPDRLFNSYSLVCYSERDLEKYFYHPEVFLREHIKEKPRSK